MLEGVEQGIVALSVHDADSRKAKEAMLRAWFEHANSGGGVARSRVKVDYPDFSSKLVLWSKFSD